MIGNERFQALVDIVRESGFKWSLWDKKCKRKGHKHKPYFEYSDHFAKELGKWLIEGSPESQKEFEAFEELFSDPRVQELLRLKQPDEVDYIVDYSQYVGLPEGSIYGLEFASIGPTGFHKDLLQVLLWLDLAIAPERILKIIEQTAGAGFATNMKCQCSCSTDLEIRSLYYIQPDLPPELYAEAEGVDTFEVHKVKPEEGWDRKNYAYWVLMQRYLREPEFRQRTWHMGHVEKGPFFFRAWGNIYRRIAERKGIKFSKFVGPMGAGTTHFGMIPLNAELVLIEWGHDGYTPFTKDEELGLEYKGEIRTEMPFIPQAYKDNTTCLDQALALYMADQGRPVGLTTASSIVAAYFLYEQANNNEPIAFPVFESTKAQNYEPGHITRTTQINPFARPLFEHLKGGVYHLPLEDGPSLWYERGK